MAYGAPVTTLALLSLGVAVDAAIVAAAFATRGAKRKDLLAMSATFGVFQGGMAWLGARASTLASGYLAAVDHWIAFGLLLAVGGKMLWESLSGGSDKARSATLRLGELLMLGLATSIDAFAVGATLPTLRLGAWESAASIGVTTTGLCLVGAAAGRRLGDKFGRAATAAGGLLLIGIGVYALR